jgi:hypothetical protein
LKIYKPSRDYEMRDPIGAASVAGGLVTGFIGLIIFSLFLFGGQIAVAGTYLMASALAFGLIAVALAINGKQRQ